MYSSDTRTIEDINWARDMLTLVEHDFNSDTQPPNATRLSMIRDLDEAIQTLEAARDRLADTTWIGLGK